MKTKKPNFKNPDVGRMGGNLADIPEPHIRLYPNPHNRRPVKVSISQFWGFAHFWASLTEAENPIWNGTLHGPSWGKHYENKVIGWQLSWDDDEGKKVRRFEKECNTESEARRFIASTLKKHFPPDQYEIEGWPKHLMPSIVHLYKHGGD